MTNRKLLEDIYGLVEDVNPNEIADHIKYGYLEQWCLNWRHEMKLRLNALNVNLFEEIEDEANDM